MSLYHENKKTLAASLITVIVLISFIMLFIRLSSSDKEQIILITEILSSNTGILYDEDGGSPDFIELYNAGKSEVNLLGWHLSDNSNRPLKWVIPSVTLAPGEYIYFFASGKDKQQSDGIWHTNFQISSGGTEKIVLTAPDGTVHRYIEPFASKPNVSFGLDADFENYIYMTAITPGHANAEPFFDDTGSIGGKTETVYISEYMTQNGHFIPDENGLYHDWVELYNPGSETVNLNNRYLTDNPDRLRKWAFPDNMSIPPGGYIVLYCSGLDTPGHVSFRLSSSDKLLILSDSNGEIIDELEIFETPLFASYARSTSNLPAGEDSLTNITGFFEVPTPGGPNNTQGFTQLAGLEQSSIGILSEAKYEQPRARHVKADTDGLYVHSGQLINLRTDEPDGKIYYTLDGREPTQNSQEYTMPIEIKENTVLRARVYTADKLPSVVFSRTYLINTENPGSTIHSIPVVALVSDPDGLFSASAGIYADGPGWTEKRPHTGANFWKNWERSANFAFYDEGELCVEADAGISIHGQNSREYPQKSFSINFKKQYRQQSGHSTLPGTGETGGTGKWRWVLYDQDHSMRMTSMNPFANMLSSAGHGGYHGEYFLTSNVIERALMRNDRIKEQFLARYAELLQTVLHPDRLIGIIDDYAAQIETEISRHIARWPGIGSAGRWQQNVELTRAFVYGRSERLSRYMQTTLNLTDEQINEIFGS